MVGCGRPTRAAAQHPRSPSPANHQLSLQSHRNAPQNPPFFKAHPLPLKTKQIFFLIVIKICNIVIAYCNDVRREITVLAGSGGYATRPRTGALATGAGAADAERAGKVDQPELSFADREWSEASSDEFQPH